MLSKIIYGARTRIFRDTRALLTKTAFALSPSFTRLTNVNPCFELLVIEKYLYPYHSLSCPYILKLIDFYKIWWTKVPVDPRSLILLSKSSISIWFENLPFHHNDVILGAIAAPVTSLTIVYSIVYSDADQRKRQSSASLAFEREIHRGPVNSPHKWPVMRKMFPFDDAIMCGKYHTNNNAFTNVWGVTCEWSTSKPQLVRRAYRSLTNVSKRSA